MCNCNNIFEGIDDKEEEDDKEEKKVDDKEEEDDKEEDEEEMFKSLFERVPAPELKDIPYHKFREQLFGVPGIDIRLV